MQPSSYGGGLKYVASAPSNIASCLVIWRTLAPSRNHSDNVQSICWIKNLGEPVRAQRFNDLVRCVSAIYFPFIAKILLYLCANILCTILMHVRWEMHALYIEFCRERQTVIEKYKRCANVCAHSHIYMFVYTEIWCKNIKLITLIPDFIDFCDNYY